MDILFIVIVVVATAILVVFYLRERAKRAALTEYTKKAEQRSEYEIESYRQQLESASQAERELIATNSRLETVNATLVEKLASQKSDIAAMQQNAQLQFEKIAAQILDEKSAKFTQTNRANIEALLTPLGKSIDTFKQKVEQTFTEETKQRSSLEAQVKELLEQTGKISAEANNLASALKGQSKTRGNWGEMILESILQQSGLVRDREYTLQEKIVDSESGKTYYPDVMVKLPDNRTIIIDSKVSLSAYDRYHAAQTPEQQSLYAKEHLRSVMNHIGELAAKNYDNLVSSLDFTMMFIPIEPAYILAVQEDSELWAKAYAKRILLISPTNLIACLKLMSDLWKRELQSKNAQEIVRRGELMYEKFVGFATSMEELGRNIDRSKSAYDAAVGQLTSGRGNLVSQAQTLRNLGLKSTKELPYESE